METRCGGQGTGLFEIAVTRDAKLLVEYSTALETRFVPLANEFGVIIECEWLNGGLSEAESVASLKLDLGWVSRGWIQLVRRSFLFWLRG